ncbi:MAG: hypothetical protein PHH60_04220 [Candidatus Margulisbacteria bacterium]|nr:hypothetical protein [Candidatus Margulisiibacteriota bacterium]
MPLNEIPVALLKLLLSPLVFADSIIAGLQLEWLQINHVLSAGGVLTLAMLLPLIKVIAIALFCLVLIAAILISTVYRILFAGIGAKRFFVIIADILLIVLAFFFYYIIIAIAIYAFFNVFLPLQELPKP